MVNILTDVVEGVYSALKMLFPANTAASPSSS
jgi:hypothetical protein